MFFLFFGFHGCLSTAGVDSVGANRPKPVPRARNLPLLAHLRLRGARRRRAAKRAVRPWGLAVDPPMEQLEPPELIRAAHSNENCSAALRYRHRKHAVARAVAACDNRTRRTRANGSSWRADRRRANHASCRWASASRRVTCVGGECCVMLARRHTAGASRRRTAETCASPLWCDFAPTARRRRCA